MLSGDLQGTVLDPLPFLAYINGLPDSLKSSDARLFADDSFLYLTMNGTIGKSPLSTGGAGASKADELATIHQSAPSYASPLTRSRKREPSSLHIYFTTESLM